MNKKILFAFSLLFLLALSLGCIGGNKNSNNNAQATSGTLNATILINGVQRNNMVLVSEQNAQIGLKLKNNGNEPIENVTGRVLGCLNSSDAFTEEVLPHTQKYLSWDVKAPELGEGEKINCPTTIRICFDYTTKGYTDLVFVPEDYNEAPPSPSHTVSGDYLGINYKFGVARVMKQGDNEMNGEITINNIGDGWVDYINYTNGMSLNTLRKVNITLIGDNIAISKFGGLDQSELSNWLSNDKKTLILTADNTKEGYSYLTKLVQGKSLFLKLNINVTNPDSFQDGTKIYQLRTEINYGYCIDIATLDTTLSGR